MIYPKCRIPLDEVVVISEYSQIGILTDNKITDYDENTYGSNVVGDTIRILCPLCDEEITESIEE